MSKSGMYKDWVPKGIYELILPPISLGQYAIYENQGNPVAFVAWAFLNEETADIYTHRKRRLRFSEWNSGDQAWIMHYMTLDVQYTKEIIGDLKREYPEVREIFFKRNGRVVRHERSQ